MGELVEKIRYEADIDDVVAKQKQLSKSGDATARDQQDAAKKAEQGWDRFAGGMERNAGRMKAVGAGMTVALTAPLVAFGVQSVGAAEDLGESRNKAREVFDQWSGDMERWAGTAAENFGLSEGAALEAAGTFGNLFTSMGLGQSAASGMSKEVVALAADLGSFNNVDPSEMLEKLRAGLVGEVEPLRAVGINLNAAAVEAKALEMGLTDASGAVTEAGKVQARLALITEQASNATGDFARTADDSANKARIVSARYEEMQATIGERLLPAKLKLLEAADGALGVFEGMPGPLQDVTIGLGGVAAAAGPTLMAVGQMATGVRGLKDAIPKMKGALSNTASFLMGPWGVALAAGAGALALFAQHQADVRALTERMRQELSDATGDITEFSDAFLVEHLRGADVLPFLEQFGLTLDDVSRAVTGTEAEYQAFLETISPGPSVRGLLGTVLPGLRDHSRDLSQNVIKLRSSWSDLNTETDLAEQLLGAASGAMDDNTTATDDNTEATQGNTAATDDHVSALTRKRDAVRALADPMFAAISSTNALEEADAAAAEAMGKFGAGSIEHEAALLRQAEAALAADADLSKLLESFQNGEADADEMRAAFERLHGQDMLDNDAANAAMAALASVLGLAEDLNAVDPTVRVNVDGDAALAEIERITGAAARLDSRHGIVVSYAGGPGGHQQRAAGGPVSPGIPYLVGEQGPELRFFNDGPGHIVDAQTTARLLEQAGTTDNRKHTEINQYFHGPVTEHLTGRASAIALRMAG